ncbi:MAG: hypothetical protein IKM61_01685 [Eubacteriaceae bacterium]|nr:hypothetical protein [Eubacteriaceae bacterium]
MRWALGSVRCKECGRCGCSTNQLRGNLIFAEWGGGAPMELRAKRSGELSGCTVL